MDSLIPPSFRDLGKSARNLFDKGFGETINFVDGCSINFYTFVSFFADYPKVKLCLKTKTESGVVSKTKFRRPIHIYLACTVCSPGVYMV